MKGILWTFLTTVVIPLMLAWLPEAAPALTRGMLSFAAVWLPPKQRWRYLREWVADVHMELHRGNKLSALFLAARIALTAPATALAVRPLRPVLAYWARWALLLFIRLQPWLILLLLVHQYLPEQLGWPPTFWDWILNPLPEIVIGLAVVMLLGVRRIQLRLAVLRGRLSRRLVPAVPQALDRHHPLVLERRWLRARPHAVDRWLNSFRSVPSSHAVQQEVPQCA